MEKIEKWTLAEIHERFDNWTDGKFVSKVSQEFRNFKNLLFYSYVYRTDGVRHDICFNIDQWFLVRARTKSD